MFLHGMDISIIFRCTIQTPSLPGTERTPIRKKLWIGADLKQISEALKKRNSVSKTAYNIVTAFPLSSIFI